RCRDDCQAVRICTLSLSERIRPKWERANRQRIAAQLGAPRPSDRPRPRSGVVGTRRGGSGLAVEAPCGAVVPPRTAGIGAKALLDWQAGMVGSPLWLPPFGPRNSPSATKTGCFVSGADGSNPSPSSGESASPMLTAIYHMLKNATKYHDLCSCAEASPPGGPREHPSL